MALAYYYINEFTTKEELKWQIEEIKNNGYEGLIISTAKGLNIGFISCEWFNITNYILKVASNLKLDVYISTEGAYPTNVLTDKYLNDIIDYKIFLYNIEDIILFSTIKDLSKLIKEKKDYLIYAETGNNQYLYIDKKNSKNIDKEKIKKIYLVKEKAIDYTLFSLYPFNLFIKNTAEEFIEHVYKRSIEVFSKYNSFKGFFEPRVVPYLHQKDSIYYHPDIAKKFEKKYNIKFSEILMNLLLPQTKNDLDLRKKYINFIEDIYLKNFLLPIINIINENNLKLILFSINYSRDSGENLYLHPTILQISKKHALIKDNISISFPIIYNRSNNITILNALSLQNLSSLGFVDKPIALITDFFNRYDFSPSKMVNLQKMAILFNIKEHIFYSHLYSIKGFRKHDIAPNIFYQNLYWKYFKYNNLFYQRINNIKDKKLEKTIYNTIIVIPDNVKHLPAEYTKHLYTNLLLLVEEALVHNISIFIITEDYLKDIKHNEIKKDDDRILFYYSLKVNKKEIKFNTLFVLLPYLMEDKNIEISKNLKAHYLNIAEIDNIFLSDKLSFNEKISYINEFYIIFDIIKNTHNDLGSKIKIPLNHNDVIAQIYNENSEDATIIMYNTSDTIGELPLTYSYKNHEYTILIKLTPRELKILSLKDLLNYKNKPEELSKYKIILKNKWLFQPQGCNILPLNEWEFKVGGGTSENLGRLHLYRTIFYSTSEFKKLNLILDGIYKEKDFTGSTKPVKIEINKEDIKEEFKPLDFAHTLFTVDISKYIRKGYNEIVIKTKGSHFTPVTLNEPQYIVGDFIVKGKDDNNKWIIDSSTTPIINGDWTQSGYPFFYGIAKLEQYFELPQKEEFKKVYIVFQHIEKPFSFQINEKEIVDVPFVEDKIEITEYVQQGINKITLYVPASMLNIFIGKMQSEGILGDINIEVI